MGITRVICCKLFDLIDHNHTWAALLGLQKIERRQRERKRERERQRETETEGESERARERDGGREYVRMCERGMQRDRDKESKKYESIGLATIIQSKEQGMRR